MELSARHGGLTADQEKEWEQYIASYSEEKRGVMRKIWSNIYKTCLKEKHVSTLFHFFHLKNITIA